MEVVNDFLLSTNSAESNYTLSPEQETTIKDFGDIVLKESQICQFDDRIGAFANAL